MPKISKKKKVETSDSDSGPEDRGPVKKPKLTTSSEKEDNSFEIGRNRSVRLTEFKGKWYVDIREFYDKDGKMLPGKRGIMLTMEQWQKFKTVVDDVDEAIKKNV